MKTTKEEFLAQISKAKHPVIILPDISDRETACAGLGIYNTLKEKKKEVSIISYKRQDPQISFLDGFEEINNKIEHARNFVLSFDTSQNEIQNVYYERTESKLNIYITPQTGAISPRDFSFAPGQFKYDFVVVLGAAELLNVGACWENNADLFFDLPIANIDNHISNEQYGQINIVDVKSSGISEIVSEVFLASNWEIPKQAADCFYAGILEATESFQSPRTTPKTLIMAASLIDKGADHKKVVRNLYKTQDIDTIKLWGRLMANMRYDASINLAWTIIDPEHFKDTKLSTSKIRSIFNKIRSSFSKASTLMVLWETSKGFARGLIQNSNRELLKELLHGIEWGNAVIFETNESLEVSESKIVKILQEGYKEA